MLPDIGLVCNSEEKGIDLKIITHPVMEMMAS
jgi:hypothetical protein